MSEPSKLANEANQLVLAAQEVTPHVQLVGGAGLALLLDHRTSRDLDLFCEGQLDVNPVVRAVEDAARRIGAEPTRVRVSPGFVRLDVLLPDAAEALRVDVAVETAPRLVSQDTLVGDVRVASLRDQRANKLVALLGRSELRDLVDLLFLERAGWPALEGLEDAVAKDGGMDPAWLAWAVGQIEIRPLGGMLQPLDQAELTRFKEAFQQGLLDRAGAGDGAP